MYAKDIRRLEQQIQKLDRDVYTTLLKLINGINANYKDIKKLEQEQKEAVSRHLIPKNN